MYQIVGIENFLGVSMVELLMRWLEVLDLTSMVQILAGKNKSL
jgi:hypothetical protein